MIGEFNVFSKVALPKYAFLITYKSYSGDILPILADEYLTDKLLSYGENRFIIISFNETDKINEQSILPINQRAEYMKNYLDEKLINKINKKCKIKKDDKFDVIVIDPPWNQGKTSHRGVRPNQGTKLDYPTLLFDDICNIPVNEWSKKGTFMFL